MKITVRHMKFCIEIIINSFTHFIETIFHVLTTPMSTVRNYEIQFHVCNVVGVSGSAINLTTAVTIPSIW